MPQVWKTNNNFVLGSPKIMMSFIKKLFCKHKDWFIVEKKVNLIYKYDPTEKDLNKLITKSTTSIIYECPKCSKRKIIFTTAKEIYNGR